MRYRIQAHKSLVLFRLIFREHQQENFDKFKISEIAMKHDVCDFIKKVHLSKSGNELFLPGVTCRASFTRFLEFLYCDRFVENITTSEIRGVADICKTLYLM